MGDSVSLYIHIPFCKQKCLYCDFPSFCGFEGEMLNYAKALSKEIDSIGNEKIRTIFIGGGTPTYLSLEGWEIIKNSIANLNKAEGLEFTVEGNPGTFSEEKLKLFKEMGVNRISIGLQAWQDKHLKALGRIHSNEEFIKSFQLSRELGFKNVNIDLMFGLPDQDLQDWKETLREVVKLDPEHLSCYSLIIEEGTPIYRLYEADKLNLPEEEVERDMYSYTLDFLNVNGYFQYEISNFSKHNFQCKHNLVYWNLQEYIGCGSSAHSYKNGFRYRNVENIEEYIKAINSNGNAIVDRKKNTIKDDMEEFMFMGLRKIEGISIGEFQQRFNISIDKVYSQVIDKYKNNGLMEEIDGYLSLSPRGIEVSNMIMSDFILKC
ncbi:MAG: radical SAM family heme chaperone HemW [Clostridium sp.]|nr:radical SAM family heme chaperone HemW [Clostridium sp.]